MTAGPDNSMQDVLDSLLREDFRSFVRKAFAHLHGEDLRPGWHIDLFVSAMGQVHAGETQRLILNAPPRSLKSFVAAVAYPAWRLGKRPRDKVMLVSHDDKLAGAHAAKVRLTMEADWYQRIFPATRLNPDHNRAGDFQTTLGGHVFARSLEAGVTGHGADLIVFDDPHDAGDVQSAVSRNRAYELVVEKYFSRLNSAVTGAIVVVMQRLHPDDLTGRLVALGGFSHVVAPLVATMPTTYLIDGEAWERPEGDVMDPGRWGSKGLAEQRRSVPAYVWSTQYQQEPVSPTAGVLQEDFFTLIDALPDLPLETYLSFDLAGAETSSGSYSVCAVVHRYDANFYISRIWRDRLDFEALKRKAVALINEYPTARVLIEEAALGVALITTLQAAGHRVVGIKPQLSKLERVQSVFDAFAERRVHVLRHEPWAPGFIEEAVQFPGGTYDDQLDAVVQCLRWLKHGKGALAYPAVVKGARTGESHAGHHPMRDPNARLPGNIMPRPRMDFRGLRGSGGFRGR